MDKTKLSMQIMKEMMTDERKIVSVTLIKTVPNSGRCTGMRLIKNHPLAYEI